MHRPTPIRCDCTHCSPPALVTWSHVLLVAVPGTVAMIIDLAGYTPTIARLLGMLS